MANFALDSTSPDGGMEEVVLNLENLGASMNQLSLSASTAGGGDDTLHQGEGRAPLNLLPIEVWSMIFDNLSTPSDLASCSNASPDFRKELKPKSTQFLFEQVLPVLIETGSFTHDQLFSRLLTLRRVCRSWKAVVDSFLENHPCNYHLNDFCTRATNIYTSPGTLEDCFRPSGRYSFSSHLELRQFTALSLETSSPCVGRSIVFDDSTNDYWESRHFWAAAWELLGEIGSSIWHCKILQMRRTTIQSLCPLLEYLPNLKVLQLSFKKNIDHAPLRPYQPEPWGTLPELPSLQVLKIKCWKPCPPFVHQLLDDYSHIKKLGLDFYDDEREELPSYYLGEDMLHVLVRSNPHAGFPYGNDTVVHPGLRFECTQRPKLEALEVAVSSSEQELSQTWQLFSNASQTLSSASILFYIPNTEESMIQLDNLGWIFCVLEAEPGRSLKSLCLTLRTNPGSTYPVSRIRKLLRLPNLEEMTIDSGENVVLEDIDFLASKSLRKLTLIRRKVKGEQEAKLVADVTDFLFTFLWDENRIYESTIWKYLPKLEQLLLKTVDEAGVWRSFYYERAKYQKRREDGNGN